MIPLGPNLSQSHPVTGSINPNWKDRIPAALDVAAHDKPNSALIGLKIAEKPLRQKACPRPAVIPDKIVIHHPGNNFKGLFTLYLIV
jgi:hypothetical protein